MAVTFFLLAAYVTVEGVRHLVADEAPNSSVVGLVLLATSLVVMPLLARAKRRVAEQLGDDPLISADAAETRICVLLSISTLLGLGLFALTGASWLDPVAGFVESAPKAARSFPFPRQKASDQKAYGEGDKEQ